MASAERLPSGRWRGLYRDADNAKQRVPGTFPRKSDALDAAVEEQAKAKRRAAAATGELSAKTSWADWWETYISDQPEDSDYAIVQQRAVDRFVMNRWGEVPLNCIKRKDVQAWVDELFRQGHSANYVRSIFQPLQVSVNAAVTAEVLDASPVAGVKLPRRPKRAKKYIEADEPAKLAPKLNAQHLDAVQFIMETGIRPGELAGMHVEQLDLKHGWLTVVNVYVKRRKVIRPRPKDGDERRVPLSAKAVEIAKRKLQGRDLTAGCGIPHSDGSTCGSDLVFRSKRGGVINPDVMSRRLREAARELKIAPKNSYAARRGFATRAIEGGADVFAVQRIMGHADLDELAGYVQETPESRARMLAALGERPPLAAVEDVGPRGTGRGTDLGNQPSPEAPKGDETNTA